METIYQKLGAVMKEVTAIDKGRKNERMLIQPQYSPVPVEEEIAMIYCGTQGLLATVPAEKVSEFEKFFIQILHSKHQSDVLDELKKGVLNDEIAAKITAVAKEVANRFKA